MDAASEEAKVPERKCIMSWLSLETPEEYRERKHREGLELHLKTLLQEITDNDDYVYVTVYDAKLILRLLKGGK